MPLPVFSILAQLALASPEAATLDTRTACDFDTIEDFIEWFAGEAERQQAASRAPLEAAFAEQNEAGDWVLETSPHAHDELGWPILPPLPYLSDYKLTYVTQADGRVLFNTAGGLGVNITYTFAKEPCWTLIELNDATQ